MQDLSTGRLELLKNEQQIPMSFRKMLERNANHKDVPVVRIGDVFKVRACHFEITEISEDGIKAKGIGTGEFIEKKFGV